MVTALIAIIGTILKAVFEVFAGMSESSSKSEAKAANERLKSTIESYDAEKKITTAAEDAKNVKVNPNDIFGAHA